MKHLSLLIILLLPAACGVGSINNTSDGTKNEKTADSLKNAISEAANEVQLLIGTASCETNEQCKAVAMGNKACGGPTFYLPYSTANIDEQNLLVQAKTHRDLSKEYNQLTGMMSDCSFLMEPPVACIDNTCQIQSP